MPRRCSPSCSTSAPQLQAAGDQPRGARAADRAALCPRAAGPPGIQRDPADVAAAPASALFIARATARDPALRLTAGGRGGDRRAVPRGWTRCRWRSSSPRHERACSRRRRSTAGSTACSAGLGQGPRDAPTRQQHDAGDARLELPTARRRGAGGVRSLGGVRGRLRSGRPPSESQARARRRRAAGRQEHADAPRRRRRSDASGDARAGSRVRGRATRRTSGRGRGGRAPWPALPRASRGGAPAA